MKNNYIVSLTTIPSKFDNLHLTIDSLVNQTILPSKIVINIPKIYNFRMNNSEICLDKINDFKNRFSNQLNQLNQSIVSVNFCDEDYGPGTKLIALLKSDMLADVDVSNTYIILVDDDIVYKTFMIETIDKEVKSGNINVASFFVYNHKLLKIGQGVDGFIMKLNKLDKFLNYYDIIKKEDYILFQDDVYISYYFYLLKEDVKQLFAPDKGIIYNLHSNSHIDALSKLQGKYSRGSVNNNSYDILNKLNNNGCFAFLHT